MLFGINDDGVRDLVIFEGLGNSFYDLIGPWKSVGVLNLSEEKLTQTKEIYELFVNLKEEYKSVIAQAIITFRYSPSIQNYKLIKLIELFSIIELLISHKPAEMDSYGSIKKQLSNKLSLINNKMNEPFDFKSYINMDQLPGKVDRTITDRVMSCLYDYRSNVAHGSSGFSNEFIALKDHENAVKLLERELIPKLLQFALLEPQLVLDLKKC